MCDIQCLHMRRVVAACNICICGRQFPYMPHMQTLDGNIYYGVATYSSLLQIIGLCCRKQSLVQGSFAKETYHFKEPTNRSQHMEWQQCGNIVATTQQQRELQVSFAKEPYEIDDILQKSPMKQTMLTPSIAMGWLHVVGSLNVQVSFAKEPYEIDDILQKRPII